MSSLTYPHNLLVDHSIRWAILAVLFSGTRSYSWPFRPMAVTVSTEQTRDRLGWTNGLRFFAWSVNFAFTAQSSRSILKSSKESNSSSFCCGKSPSVAANIVGVTILLVPEGGEWRGVRNRQRIHISACGALGRLTVNRNESGSDWIFIRFSLISLSE